MALMLVIPAVALAAVLSYAVLANVGTQDQVSANAALLAQADCLAESGVNYAMYELQQNVTNQNIPPINFSNTTAAGNLQESFVVTAESTLAASGTEVTSTITSSATIAMVGGTNSIARKVVATVQMPLGTPPASGSSSGPAPSWMSPGSPTMTPGSTTIPTTLGPPLLVPQNVQGTCWSQ
jgi:hypothetical protein